MWRSPLRCRVTPSLHGSRGRIVRITLTLTWSKGLYWERRVSSRWITLSCDCFSEGQCRCFFFQSIIAVSLGSKEKWPQDPVGRWHCLNFLNTRPLPGGKNSRVYLYSAWENGYFCQRWSIIDIWGYIQSIFLYFFFFFSLCNKLLVDVVPVGWKRRLFF